MKVYRVTSWTHAAGTGSTQQFFVSMEEARKYAVQLKRAYRKDPGSFPAGPPDPQTVRVDIPGKVKDLCGWLNAYCSNH